jgi:hypothetical protein
MKFSQSKGYVYIKDLLYLYILNDDMSLSLLSYYYKDSY